MCYDAIAYMYSSIAYSFSFFFRILEFVYVRACSASNAYSIVSNKSGRDVTDSKGVTFGVMTDTTGLDW
jgi:hypothetical protein